MTDEILLEKLTKIIETQAKQSASIEGISERMERQEDVVNEKFTLLFDKIDSLEKRVSFLEKAPANKASEILNGVLKIVGTGFIGWILVLVSKALGV